MEKTKKEKSINVKWHIQKLSNLPTVKNLSACYFQNKIIFFGGFNGITDINSVYCYEIDKQTWNLVVCSGSIPKGRNGHTATLKCKYYFYSFLGNTMYVIGGWLGESASDEVYALNLDKWEWKLINTKPSIGPANMHTSNLYNDEIIIFR